MGILKKILVILFALLLSGCIYNINPFKKNTFVVNEGYLSIGKINENIKKQLPLIQNAGTNKIKIVNAKIYSANDKKHLIIEVDFIFTSFEIPEGTPVVARFKSGIFYDIKTKEFKFNNLELIDIKFLKEELLEYVSPLQKRFIIDTLKYLLKKVVLYKSIKELKSIKSIEVTNGKIKIVFN